MSFSTFERIFETKTKTKVQICDRINWSTSLANILLSWNSCKVLERLQIAKKRGSFFVEIMVSLENPSRDERVADVLELQEKNCCRNCRDMAWMECKITWKWFGWLGTITAKFCQNQYFRNLGLDVERKLRESYYCCW